MKIKVFITVLIFFHNYLGSEVVAARTRTAVDSIGKEQKAGSGQVNNSCGYQRCNNFLALDEYGKEGNFTGFRAHPAAQTQRSKSNH